MKKLLLLLLCVPLIGIGQSTLLVPSQYSTIQNAINASFKERLKHLISTLLSNKLAVMFECKDSSEKTTYMAIFSCFNNKATYMYGSPNKLNQRTFDGTYMLWESFKVLFEKYKIEEVDLEGVNSPFRGKYKLSFGGKLMTYYEVALK